MILLKRPAFAVSTTKEVQGKVLGDNKLEGSHVNGEPFFVPISEEKKKELITAIHSDKKLKRFKAKMNEYDFKFINRLKELHQINGLNYPYWDNNDGKSQAVQHPNLA